ncbi:MAG: class I SAM-dependent methyltransferase, partial [Anaerolineae bacterium]|nr:class I SAM-dependent methyltransferase [Anaerolineae bacterium]
MNTLEKLYKSTYAFLCGQHPHLYFWHDQWLATKDLYAHLREWLPQIQGRVLDVGCGPKPYQRWMINVTEYVGLDLPHNPAADIHVKPDKRWPLPESSFDVVLCSQVIEHVQNLRLTLAEIDRVLKPGGRLILSAPFIYNLHGPQDFRRFSAAELEQLLAPNYILQTVMIEGGIGSNLGILFLNWLELYLQQWKLTRLLKGLLLPLWIALSALVNTGGYLWDKLDT